MILTHKLATFARRRDRRTFGMECQHRHNDEPAQWSRRDVPNGSAAGSTPSLVVFAVRGSFRFIPTPSLTLQRDAHTPHEARNERHDKKRPEFPTFVPPALLS